jgi:hypothetical protein
MRSTPVQNGNNRVKQAPFNERTQQRITEQLSRLSQVIQFSWELTEEELTIRDLDNEEPFNLIVFTHRAPAEAFLDAYLLGYNHGYGHARLDSKEESPS